MYSIKEEFIKEIEVEHSRFIGIVKPITNKDDIKQIISEIKKRYPKAKHYCYATIIDNFQKSSDDGEPQGTAGRPMLDLLIKSDLNNVLLIVVRYFGGILLGASRLLRTYVETADLTIKSADLYKICNGFSYHITTSYNNYDAIIRHCKSNALLVENTQFNENVELEVFSETDIINQFKEQFYQDTKIEYVNSKVIYKKVEE
ncbi:MAG: YigZ family protein [Erysipelotrichales bacterium]|nr:YigZ family protein [Erysipelotrichales bacterium]